jgi:hypothetical protein
MATQTHDDPANAGPAPRGTESQRDDPGQGSHTGRQADRAHGLTESQSAYAQETQDERAPGSSTGGHEARVRSNYVTDEGDALAVPEDSSQALDSAWNGAEARTPGQRPDGLREPAR